MEIWHALKFKLNCCSTHKFKDFSWVRWTFWLISICQIMKWNWIFHTNEMNWMRDTKILTLFTNTSKLELAYNAQLTRNRGLDKNKIQYAVRVAGLYETRLLKLTNKSAIPNFKWVTSNLFCDLNSKCAWLFLSWAF